MLQAMHQLLGDKAPDTDKQVELHHRYQITIIYITHFTFGN